MTLTETAYWTRSAIKYGIVFIVALIVLRIGWIVGFGVYRSVFPAGPPAPEVKFGKLESLKFEQKPGFPVYTFSLQTPTGDLPALPPQAAVYFMPTPQSSFLDLEEARKLAVSLGFVGNGEGLSEVIYRFNHSQNPQTLDINIVNKTLSVSYDLTNDSGLSGLRPTSGEDTLKSAQAFLNSGGLLVDDLTTGKQTFEFLKTGEQVLEPVTSISEANFVRVNFFRKDYGGLPVLTGKRDRANVWLLISGESSSQKQVIAGEYHYFSVAEGQNSTYPLRAPKEAWEELNGGKGFIVFGPEDKNSVVVRRMYLAYFDSGTPQQFLQPVFVFDGDDNFRAIVPAVTVEYYGN